MITRLRNKPDEKRIKERNIFSFTKRGLRGDPIEVIKLFKGFTYPNINDYITFDETHVTRKHGYEIKGRRFRMNGTN